MPHLEAKKGPPGDELLAIKENIRRNWDQLPPEHQATMALVLYQQTLEGEYGPWLRSAARITDPQESESPFRFLPIVRISRAHLENANLTEDEISGLDDENLMSISHAIVRHYTNDVFWEELEFPARLTLAEKGAR